MGVSRTALAADLQRSLTQRDPVPFQSTGCASPSSAFPLQPREALLSRAAQKETLINMSVSNALRGLWALDHMAGLQTSKGPQKPHLDEFDVK